MRIVFPFCNSSNVVKILYGMPNELGIEEYKKGLIHLGGCCVSNGHFSYVFNEMIFKFYLFSE